MNRQPVRESTSVSLSQSYLEPLLSGDRVVCRSVIDGALKMGMEPHDLLTGLVWPTMELLQSLYREDRINISMLNMATRLNRSLTDQLTAQLTRKEANGKKVLIFCGNAEPEELGGQICADLFECEGYTVRFAGGGVPADEVLQLIGDLRPDLLIMFGTLASGVPAVRKLIDNLREMNACPEMQIMCCGGIYKRAEGLADEIGADLYAPDAAIAVQVAEENSGRKATLDQQTVGRTRRIRKAAARKATKSTRLPHREGPHINEDHEPMNEAA
jgi:MerR family transcriptional regulator, light-induced transcriptional regulator